MIPPTTTPEVGDGLVDPRLPALPRLLDPEQATQMIAAALGGRARVASARPRHVRHENGVRVVVRYAVDVTWRGGGDRVETVVAEHGPPDPPPGTAVLDDGAGNRVAMWRYPFDPYLPGLATVAHTGPMADLLQRLGWPHDGVAVVPRAYRPTRRAVLQVRAGGSREADVCYVKVVRPHVLARIDAAHGAAGAAVPVPAVRASAPAEGVVVFDALPGRPLRDLLLGAGRLPDPAAVMALQRRLRRAPAADLPAARALEPRRHAAVLARLLPGEAALIGEVAERAAAAAQPSDAVVHGDLYEAQIVVDDADGHLSLLDLDGLGRGPFVDDCATMLGHLHVLGDWRPTAAPRVDAWRVGYAAACSDFVDPVVLRQRAAGVVLGLAAGGFAVQESGWAEIARARLAIAARLSGIVG